MRSRLSSTASAIGCGSTRRADSLDGLTAFSCAGRYGLTDVDRHGGGIVPVKGGNWLVGLEGACVVDGVYAGTKESPGWQVHSASRQQGIRDARTKLLLSSGLYGSYDC